MKLLPLPPDVRTAGSGSEDDVREPLFQFVTGANNIFCAGESGGLLLIRENEVRMFKRVVKVLSESTHNPRVRTCNSNLSIRLLSDSERLFYRSTTRVRIRENIPLDEQPLRVRDTFRINVLWRQMRARAKRCSHGALRVRSE